MRWGFVFAAGVSVGGVAVAACLAGVAAVLVDRVRTERASHRAVGWARMGS